MAAVGDPAGEHWPSRPIRDLTTKELVAVIGYLEVAGRDGALIRALQLELTLRQAGIRCGQTSRPVTNLWQRFRLRQRADEMRRPVLLWIGH